VLPDRFPASAGEAAHEREPYADELRLALKTVADPHPALRSRQAHIIDLPELCPASRNPGAGSLLCIRYTRYVCGRFIVSPPWDSKCALRSLLDLGLRQCGLQWAGRGRDSLPKCDVSCPGLRRPSKSGTGAQAAAPDAAMKSGKPTPVRFLGWSDSRPQLMCLLESRK
jgi:hypothetical protein